MQGTMQAMFGVLLILSIAASTQLSILKTICTTDNDCKPFATRGACNLTEGACDCVYAEYPYIDMTHDVCQKWEGRAGDPCLTQLDCWQDTQLICNRTYPDSGSAEDVGTCLCPDPTPLFYRGSCYSEVVDYDSGACSSTEQCQASFGQHTFCNISSKSVCRCSDGALYISGGCWLQHDLNGTCVDTHECSAAFSECEGGRCRCRSGFREQTEPRTLQRVCVSAGAGVQPTVAALLLLIAVACAGRSS